jgi:uncharacterized protein (TIGR03066 family)
MRNSFPYLLLVPAVFCTLSAYGDGTTAQAEDGLFSRVPIESVFAPAGAPTGAAGTSQAPAPPPASLSPAPQASGPKGSSALLEIVRRAGFEPSAISEDTVALKVKQDPSEFQLLITAQKDRSQLHLTMLLGVLNDATQASSARLLQLMDANREHAPAYFAYNAPQKRTELHRIVDIDGGSIDQLRDAINQLAATAKQTESLWNFAFASAPVAPPTKSGPSNSTTGTPPAPSATQTPSLVGKWSAARSQKEAFAMLLKTDGSFVLVHIKDGKQTRSKGTFTLQGQLLTLSASDGGKLVGTVSNTTDKEFHFQPQSAGKSSASLTFKRAS